MATANSQQAQDFPDGGFNRILSAGFKGYIGGMPIKEEYANTPNAQKEWRIDTYKRLMSKGANRMYYKHNMWRMAIDMYLAATKTDNIPVYARLPDTDEATSLMPYENMNPLFAPINKRVGAFKLSKYDINAYIVNEEAKSRKQDFYLSHIVSTAMGENQPAVESFLGPQPNPQAEIAAQGYTGTVEEYMEDDSYRDRWEREAEKVLKSWMERTRFKQTLDQIYMYYALTQTAVLYPKVNPATLETEIYPTDPTFCIWDLDCRDEYGRDMQWFIKYEYVAENEILHRYPQLTRDELEQMTRTANPPVYSQNYPAWKVSQVDKTMYFLTANARWIYTERKKVSDAKLEVSNGEPVEVEGDDKEITYEQVYYSVIIGDMYELEGGVVPNQVRSVDVFAKADLGIYVLSLGTTLNPTAPTNIARIESLINMRNMLFYKATSLIADIKGLFMEIDESLIPRDIQGQPNYREFMAMLQSDKLIVRDSTEASMTMDAASLRAQEMINIKEIGLPGGQTIQQIVGMINIVSNELNSILGWNSASMGNIGQYQNAETAQLNMSAYQAALAFEDESFDRIIEMFLQWVANQEKILTTIKRERNADYHNDQIEDAIAIRDGDDILYMPTDSFLFQDISIIVKRRKDLEQKRQELQAMITAGMQQGSVGLDEALILMEHDDVMEAIFALKKMLKEKRKEAQAQAQQIQAQKAQEMQMQAQMQLNLKQQEIAANAQAKMAHEQQSKDLAARNAKINAEENANIQRENQQFELAKEAAIPQQA